MATNRFQTCQHKRFYDAAVRDVHASTKVLHFNFFPLPHDMMQAPAFLPNLGVDLCEEDPLTSPGAGLQKALHSRSQAMRKCLVTQPFDIVPTFRLQRAAKLAAQCLYENRRTRLQLYDYTTLIVLETLSPSAAGLESFI